MIVLSLNVMSLQVCKFIGNRNPFKGKNIYHSCAAIARICTEVVKIADRRMIEFAEAHSNKQEESYTISAAPVTKKCTTM
jgi:hypothetical protein